MPDWFGPAVITALGGVVVAGIAFLSSRGSTRAQIDKRIDERVQASLNAAWARIDALEADQKMHTEQMQAVARILRAIARQWPDAHGPDLAPSDIALIADTIPAHWVRK